MLGRAPLGNKKRHKWTCSASRCTQILTHRLRVVSLESYRKCQTRTHAMAVSWSRYDNEKGRDRRLHHRPVIYLVAIIIDIPEALVAGGGERKTTRTKSRQHFRQRHRRGTPAETHNFIREFVRTPNSIPRMMLHNSGN